MSKERERERALQDIPNSFPTQLNLTIQVSFRKPLSFFFLGCRACRQAGNNRSIYSEKGGGNNFVKEGLRETANYIDRPIVESSHGDAKCLGTLKCNY